MKDKDSKIHTNWFITKNICDNKKYIPTMKYAIITPSQKVQEKFSWIFNFKIYPPILQDTIQ